MPLEEDPGLTRGESSCIQLKNGGALQQKEGTAVTEFSPTMLSGCQLNHMLPTWNSPIGVKRLAQQ